MIKTDEEEADALAESMEEAFTSGMINRYIQIKGVGNILEAIRQRACGNDYKMVVVSAFSLGVILGRSIGNLDKLMTKEEGVEVTKGTTE